MAISLETLQRSNLMPARILIYGVQGIGKTTLAANMPNPVFLASEDGLGGLVDIPHWDIESHQDVIDGIKTLITEEHDFKTVVLDTVSALEVVLHEQLLAD